MSLSQLNIHHLRNLRRAEMAGLERINVLYGDNGSGKTSALEAIYLLGRARSFRAASVRTLITHGEEHCVVQGTVVTPGGVRTTLGVQRGLNGELALRINGATVRTVAELLEHLPVQVINASSFDLLTGAPPSRRQYLNWGVFHVEHRFLPEWQRFQRCIKQRNTGLRRGKLARQEVSVWTRELGRSGSVLNDYRQAYFARLAPLFRDLMGRLLPHLGELELRLRQGWDRRMSYPEALEATLGSDMERGFTQVGPQRADIRVMVAGHQAADVLSRGQQKLVICGLKLAQGLLLQAAGARQCTYLLDDLPSELDTAHCQRVAEELDAMQAQVFISCVARDDVLRVWPESSRPVMFHVEHGLIRKD